MLEIRIKKLLDSIIDAAYPDLTPQQARLYKGYYISIYPQQMKSKNGDYNGATRTIRIFNPSKGKEGIAKTLLHELSHHIEYIQYGRCGHQENFYAAYEKLIHAALDLGILTRQDVIDAAMRSRGRDKILKIVQRYVPNRNIKKPEVKKQVIRVYNAYQVKDELKERGYEWNKLEQTWDLETEDPEAEKAFLEEKNVSSEAAGKAPYYTASDPQLYIRPIIYIEAYGNTYDSRDVLKEHGFTYRKETRTWRRKIYAGEKTDILKELRQDERLKKVMLRTSDAKK